MKRTGMIKWLRENIFKPLGEISDKAEQLQEAITEMNEEISNLKSQLKRYESENIYLNEKLRQFEDTSQRIITSINCIADDLQKRANQDVENRCKMLESHNVALKELYEASKKSRELFLEMLSSKNSEVEELVNCLNTLCNGAYNTNFIEFFALKTYRGWKYICHDGESTVDFDNITGVEVCWKQNGKVTVDYEYKDDKSDE